MTPIKRKKRAHAREYDSYCLEILNWEVPYSFSMNQNTLLNNGPFSEYLALELWGRMLDPGKFIGIEVRIVILGKRTEENALKNPYKPLRYEPRCLGVITLRGQQRDYLGSMPFDASILAGNLLALGHYRYLVLSGQALYRGKADITSLHFYKEFRPEDWF